MVSLQFFFKNQPLHAKKSNAKRKDLDMKQLQRCTTWNLFTMIH